MASHLNYVVDWFLSLLASISGFHSRLSGWLLGTSNPIDTTWGQFDKATSEDHPYEPDLTLPGYKSRSFWIEEISSSKQEVVGVHF